MEAPPPMYATYLDAVARKGDLSEMKRVAAAARERLRRQDELEAALHTLERSIDRRR